MGISFKVAQEMASLTQLIENVEQSLFNWEETVGLW